MYLLGLSCFYHDSSATLLKNGEVLAAVQEERFTRKKHDISFPKNAVEFCLKKADISIDQIDYIAFYEKPLLKFERLLYQHINYFPRSYKVFLSNMPSWFNEKLRVTKKVKKELGFKGTILFIEHHMAHAASSFFTSPFDKAAILTMDGVGEWTTTAYGSGNGNIGFAYKADGGGGFQAPQISVGQAEGSGSAASGLIALGILMLIPEAVEMSKKWLGAKGLMDEWLPKIGQNLGKGWKGGKLIEGLDFTDTSKWNVGGMGALSTENILRKGAMGAFGAGGAAFGAGTAIRKKQPILSVINQATETGTEAMIGFGKVFKDPQAEQWEKDKKEAETKKKEAEKRATPTRQA